MTPRALLRCRRGSVAVETALVSFALFALILGTFEIGRAFYAQDRLVTAAEAGARAALLDPGLDDAALIEVARAELGDFREETSLEVAATGAGSGRALTLTLPLRLYVLDLFPAPLSLSATRRLPAA